MNGDVVGMVVAALGSILLAEIVRDVRHWLAHVYPRLLPKHAWHHRVFRPDLSVPDPEFYRTAQWHHDVPEAATMLLVTALVAGSLGWWMPSWGWGAGPLYSATFLASGVARGLGLALETDATHKQGPFERPPDPWWVNRTYHWRHHFDDTNAYFCGVLTLVDRIMGTALSLRGKTIAVTGASGSLGRGLLRHLQAEGAKVIALSSQPEPILLANGAVETVSWQVGQEQALAELLERVDILVLNHGINVHAQRSAAAIESSYAINAFSSWRLMELFLATVRTNADIACKEVWVNTTEAEAQPAFSPLYELSKRTLGDLVTLRRLDSPCIIRKLILGPFKSNLNPIGVMDPDWVAAKIVGWAKRGARDIIVTINPLTYLLFPPKELFTSLYFRLFSRPTPLPVSRESSERIQHQDPV